MGAPSSGTALLGCESFLLAWIARDIATIWISHTWSGLSTFILSAMATKKGSCPTGSFPMRSFTARGRRRLTKFSNCECQEVTGFVREPTGKNLATKVHLKRLEQRRRLEQRLEVRSIKAGLGYPM